MTVLSCEGSTSEFRGSKAAGEHRQHRQLREHRRPPVPEPPPLLLAAERTCRWQGTATYVGVPRPRPRDLRRGLGSHRQPDVPEGHGPRRVAAWSGRRREHGSRNDHRRRPRALGHRGDPADDRVDLPAAEPARVEPAFRAVPELQHARRRAGSDAVRQGRVHRHPHQAVDRDRRNDVRRRRLRPDQALPDGLQDERHVPAGEGARVPLLRSLRVRHERPRPAAPAGSAAAPRTARRLRPVRRRLRRHLRLLPRRLRCANYAFASERDATGVAFPQLRLELGECARVPRSRSASAASLAARSASLAARSASFAARSASFAARSASSGVGTSD